MLEFYNGALPIARKEHQCEYCGKTIVPGEQYSVESGKFEGDFFTRKLCMVCKNFLSAYCSEYDEEFDWDEVTEYLSDKHYSGCSKREYDSCDLMPYDCLVIRNKYMEGVL